MADIKSVRLLWLKFALFVFLGLLATTLALCLYPSLQLALLMALAIWAFCRAYYFAFYVLEHYVDPQYRFAGLSSFVRYALQKEKRKSSAGTMAGPEADEDFR